MQLQHLIHNNTDIAKLSEDGFDLSVDGNYLLVDRIPYLNQAKEVKYGRLVCLLSLATPDKLSAPSDHTLYFVGEQPYDVEGNVLKAVNHSNKTQLTPSIAGDHYFSSKHSQNGYKDYHEKIWTYAQILSTQAKSIDNSVTPRPNKKNTNHEQ